MKKEKQYRTHRKEVQLSEEEFLTIHSKAITAGLQDAVYIREAALGHELKAALSSEERKLFQKATSISSRFLNNLNQLARLANMFKMSKKVVDAILDFIKRADSYFRGEEYEPMDTFSLEIQLKEDNRNLDVLSTKMQDQMSIQTELQQLKDEIAKKNEELYNARWWYTECFYYTKKGEDKLKEDFGFYCYQSERDGYMFIKQIDQMSFKLPDDLVHQYRIREKSLKDLYEYYLQNKD